MNISLRKWGFPLGEVEAIFAHMFGIHPAKRATFAARLQQLQRLGLPSGAQPGRGTRFRYEFWQVADFAVFVDLLDAGIPPNVLRVHFAKRGGIFSSSDLAKEIEICKPTAEDGIHLYAEFKALDYLRTTDLDEDLDRSAGASVNFQVGMRYLRDRTTANPLVVLNLSKRLNDLKEAVSAVLPREADQATFIDPPQEQVRVR